MPVQSHWPIPFIPEPANLAIDSFISFIASALLAILVNAEGQAWVATLLGDVRPEAKDRFHYNAFLHLDILGSLCFLVAGFGWPRPIDIDPAKFKHPRPYTFLARLAGPFANILLANIAASFIFLLKLIDMDPLVFLMVVGVNVTIAVYNLLPLPPLAFGSLVTVWLPDRFRELFMLASPFIIMAIFLIERITHQGIISPYLNPIVHAVVKFITG